MTFSPRIRTIGKGDVQIDPLSQRPKIIAAGGHAPNGVVMVYADWCPHCRMFKPWYNEYAETRASEDALLGVILSDEVEEIFEGDEVPGFPCFKRVQNGVIDRSELPINRSSQIAAFESLDEHLNMPATMSDVHKPLEELEQRLHELELYRQKNAVTDAELKNLRAALAKAAAIEAVYQHQLRALQDRLHVCEQQHAQAKPQTKTAPLKKVAASKKLTSKKVVSKKAASKKRVSKKMTSPAPVVARRRQQRY